MKIFLQYIRKMEAVGYLKTLEVFTPSSHESASDEPIIQRSFHSLCFISDAMRPISIKFGRLNMGHY